MSKIRKAYIVLPAYNEAPTLSQLIQRIARALQDAARPFEIIVVNDGSSDDTSAVLASLPPSFALKELRHTVNLGYGASLRTAFLWIAERAKPEDAIVTLDADNTHDPKYIPKLLLELEKGYDGVTASYLAPGGKAHGVPLLRRGMSRIINILFHLRMPIDHVLTYTNGFRAYRVSSLQTVHQRHQTHLIEESGFPGGTEFFLKVVSLGGRLSEIPFELQYENRKAGTKIRALPSAWRYVRLLFGVSPPIRPTEVISPTGRRLAVILLALTAFGPTLHVGFLWDDHVMIESNPTLAEWSLRSLKHDFTTDVFDGSGDPYYRPAETIMNRVEYTLWGLRPFAFHVTNLAGHALNAILLQELVIALGFGNLVALLVGCLFAVNPIPVEQLMIVAGRAELFGFTLTLATFLLLLREESWCWVLGAASYAAALLFKESALIAPAVLACLYAYKGAKPSVYWRLLPLLLLDLPYLALRHHAVGSLLPPLKISYMAKFFFEAFPKVLITYARLIMVPWNLHSHRLMPHLSHLWPVWLAVIVGSVIYLFKKKNRVGLFAVAWFVLMLLPKTPLMMYGNFMLDHWAYTASFGILLPLAVGYESLWHERRSSRRYWLGVTLFPLLIIWALLVRLNVELRGTDEKMYRWALHFTTSHPIMFNLGALLLQNGRPLEALPYLVDYQSAYPEDPRVHYALAQAYWQLGHPGASMSQSRPLLRTNPEYRERINTLHASPSR